MNHTSHHHHMHNCLPIAGSSHSSDCMQMSFSSLADYQLKLLFSWWDINNRYSFNVAWCVVCASVVGMHALRYYLSLIESKLSSAKKENGSVEGNHFAAAYSMDDKKTFPVYVPSNKHQLRLLHALLNGLLYTVKFLFVLLFSLFIGFRLACY